jgi:hypothetical protein
MGFSIESTDRYVIRLERFFTILPDSMQVIQSWRQLVVAHAVRGVQVHDTRLVATMKAYNIPQIVTFNVGILRGSPILKSSILRALLKAGNDGVAFRDRGPVYLSLVEVIAMASAAGADLTRRRSPSGESRD